MLKVIDGAKGVVYYTIKDAKSHQYGNTIKIDLENASQEELKLLNDEKGGHPFIKEADKKAKAE